MPNQDRTLSQGLTEQQWLRYSNNLLVQEVGESGQQALLQSHVVIIGLGGLGCPASQYLASSGVGTLTLIDHDTVCISNLQRQTLYTTQDIGLSKAEQAKKRLVQLNPDPTYLTSAERVDEDNIEDLLDGADLVLDCTDNRAVRYAINQACQKLCIPWVSATARGLLGQLIAFRPQADHGCYHCLYPQGTDEPLNCSNAGIIAPIVGMIGAYQALMAIRYLCGLDVPWGALHVFDASMTLPIHSWQIFHVPRAQSCSICHAT